MTREEVVKALRERRVGAGWGDPLDQAAADLIERQAKALEPFALIGREIGKVSKDGRWLETVLFYAGDDDDPQKWSLTGRAFDQAARAALEEG